MKPNREIAITGMGIFSPVGIGQEPFWASLCEGRSGIRTLPLFEGADPPTPFGGEVADFDPKQFVRPRKSLKVMSRDIQLGFAAADMAWEKAGLTAGSVDPDRIGVFQGADLMPCDLDELVGAFRACMVEGRFDFSRWGQAFLAEIFPLWMLKYLPNMPACHIGIAQDLRGPNNTITLGEVSTLTAFQGAFYTIQRNQADVMIAGGVSSRIHHALWARNMIHGQSKRYANPQAASRPFDAQRDGLVPSECAGTLVLEELTSAGARGANVLAKVLGCSARFEPHRKGQALQGTAIRQAIEAAVQASGLTSADIGCVVAHGASRVDGDRNEAKAIREALGDVPVAALKGNYGHPGAASGAAELVLAVLALQHGLVPPALNYDHPDPECPVNVVHGQPKTLDRRVALVLCHSPQGQAVAVVLGGV